MNLKFTYCLLPQNTSSSPIEKSFKNQNAILIFYMWMCDCLNNNTDQKIKLKPLWFHFCSRLNYYTFYLKKNFRNKLI